MTQDTFTHWLFYLVSIYDPVFYGDAVICEVRGL